MHFFLGQIGLSEQICGFWRSDARSGPNILGQNLEIMSEHIARILGNFEVALSHIIGGPCAGSIAFTEFHGSSGFI